MKLTREKFPDALRKGHGRALQHVREHGDAGVEDLLLDACLHDLSFDQQSEGNRGAWLMEMLAALPDPSAYYLAVMAAFVESSSDHDVDQMAAMVRRMAEQGVARARGALYAKFDRQEFSEWTIAPHLVVLDREEGLLYAASGLGRRLSTDAEFWLDDTRGWFEEELGSEVAAAAVNRAAETDEDVRRFRDAFSVKDDASSSPSKPRPKLSLDEFLSHVAEGKRYIRGGARRFGRGATKDELLRLMELTEQEGDPVRVAAMLMAFAAADDPGDPQPLLRFARSDVAPIRDAAIEALALIEDPRVGELSRELLAGGSVEGARLLALNYDDGQFQQLMDLLPLEVDRQRLHDIGFDMLEVCRDRPACAAGLIWMYEATPCSLCRNSAVRELVELDRLPKAIAAECRDDCNHETRELVS